MASFQAFEQRAGIESEPARWLSSACHERRQGRMPTKGRSRPISRGGPENGPPHFAANERRALGMTWETWDCGSILGVAGR